MSLKPFKLFPPRGMYPRVRERLEKLALELADLLERLDAQEPLSREGVPLVLPKSRFCLHIGIAILYTYGTCPVQTCGRASTNLGRATGQGGAELDLADLLERLDSQEPLSREGVPLILRE